MKIADSKLKVLEVLWFENPLTVGQVIERVQKTEYLKFHRYVKIQKKVNFH